MPFVKGDPRINRKGRPLVGQTFAEYVRNFMETPDEKTKETIVAEMMQLAVSRAKKGSFQFWDALVNRAYGKVADKVEIDNQEKPDLSKLTKEEIEIWMKLLEKSKPKP